MAINACTIDGFTLHGRSCRDKFAALVPILHPPVVTSTVGGAARVLRDTFRIPDFAIDDRAPLEFEQPEVTISVEFLGTIGSETQHVATAQLDFVTVTNLEIDGVEPIVAVNIHDFRIES